MKDKDRRKLEKLRSSRAMTPQELIALALQEGFHLESGGKHSKLVHEDGRKIPISLRPSMKDLSKGQLTTALKVIYRSKS